MNAIAGHVSMCVMLHATPERKLLWCHILLTSKWSVTNWFLQIMVEFVWLFKNYFLFINEITKGMFLRNMYLYNLHPKKVNLRISPAKLFLEKQKYKLLLGYIKTVVAELCILRCNSTIFFFAALWIRFDKKFLTLALIFKC